MARRYVTLRAGVCAWSVGAVPDELIAGHGVGNRAARAWDKDVGQLYDVGDHCRPSGDSLVVPGFRGIGGEGHFGGHTADLGPGSVDRQLPGTEIGRAHV